MSRKARRYANLRMTGVNGHNKMLVGSERVQAGDGSHEWTIQRRDKALKIVPNFGNVRFVNLAVYVASSAALASGMYRCLDALCRASDAWQAVEAMLLVCSPHI